MYNRYLNSAPPAEPPAQPFCADTQKTAESFHPFGGFEQHLQQLHLDSDTLIVLAVVWFILHDETEEKPSSELLLAIGALLFLGL